MDTVVGILNTHLLGPLAGTPARSVPAHAWHETMKLQEPTMHACAPRSLLPTGRDGAGML